MTNNYIKQPYIPFPYCAKHYEPSPHLSVYVAVTEIIADAEFMSFIDKPDGTRVYQFKRNDTTVLLAFNWKQDNSELTIR